MTPQTEIGRTHLAKAVFSTMPKGIAFKGNKGFYEALGINRIRFSQLLKGEKEPTVSELRKISNHFNLEIKDLI